MSAPPVPSFFASVGVVFRLSWLRALRGRKPLLAAIAVALVVACVLVTHFLAKDADAERVVKFGLDFGFFHLLVYLLPFLLASTVIAEEVESRTFVYLTARPVGRIAVSLGKYLVAVAISAGLIVVGGLVIHLVVLAGTPAKLSEAFPSTLRTLGALALLDAAYCAICFMWGTLAVEAATVVSALYLLVIEFCGSWLPGVFRLVSANYAAQQLAGLEKGGLGASSAVDLSAPIASAILVGFTLFFLFIGALTVQTSEFRFAKS